MTKTYSRSIYGENNKSDDWRNFCSFRHFLADKIIYFIICCVVCAGYTLFAIVLKVEPLTMIVMNLLIILPTIVVLVVEYLRRRNFYRSLVGRLAQLDKAYLILETLERPNFYDGKFFYEILYEINKSMLEEIETYSAKSESFRDYIELWVHEAKTPLSTLSLISHTPAVAEQITRLDNYVEQVLFFSRAENAERDYYIKPTNLSRVVADIANLNREIIQAKHIDLSVRNLDIVVETDAKWLRFIINQIITNSIKYRSSRIEILAIPTSDDVTLKIIDNGIGISPKDLPRVFEKSFTGENGHLSGRNSRKSTGMGLYIAKMLCDQLGHKIKISSEKGRFTAVEIVFNKNDYYDVTKK